MLKAYKYRIYPNKHQKILLAKHFGCTRFVYNWALALKNKAYEDTGKSPSRFELQKQLPSMKKSQEFEWLKEVNSQSLQATLNHLDIAFQNFFKGLGKKEDGTSKHPTFKKKFSKQSYEIPQNTKVDFKNKRVFVPKFGKKGIKCHFSREFKGTVRTCTISKNCSDQYFVSILVDNSIKLPQKPIIKADNTIGIDLGIKDFAVTSEKENFSNPKNLKKLEKKLTKAQKSLSHKVKGSNNRIKAKLKVAKIHQKIKNRRQDFLHKLSTKLIRENQTICLEDLSIKNMMEKNSSELAKSIADCSWYEFRRMLEYKADWYGKNIIKIGKFDPSSKLCSCGVKNNTLKLTDRIWTCKSCGSTHNRDYLGSWNIKKFGLIQNKIPLGQRKYMPLSYGSTLVGTEEESPKSLA